MTDYPKVSVVTITYGHEHFITQTLDGVFMQDYPGEIEFIIANDNSPDATDRVIRDYLAVKIIPTNFTIKYTVHEVNKGGVSNFSWALEQASGKYVALCEGDDYWTDPLKLQKQVNFLERNSEYSLCFTAKSNIDNEGVFVGEAKYGYKEIWSKEDVLDGGFIAGLQTIVSKNLSKEFNEYCNHFPQRTGADRLYTYFYGIKGKLKYLDENMSVYRIHDGGMWSTLSEREKLMGHIKQHTIFLKKIAKNRQHYKQLEKNMFRLIITKMYFKFFTTPAETSRRLVFVLIKYRQSPQVFFLAAEDFVKYYYKIIRSKVRRSKI